MGAADYPPYSLAILRVLCALMSSSTSTFQSCPLSSVSCCCWAARRSPPAQSFEKKLLLHILRPLQHLLRVVKDGNVAVLGRISAGFGSSGFGFGLDFSPTVFGFGAPKLIGSGFSPVDIQWITEISHYELKFMFYYILIILFTYILF
jgi:hypothetical protein